MSPVNDRSRQIAKTLIETIDRFVDESLTTDPDLVNMSEDYKSGYREGFKECALGQLSKQLRMRDGD